MSLYRGWSHTTSLAVCDTAGDGQDNHPVDPTMLALVQNDDLVDDASSVSVDAAGNMVIACMLAGAIITNTILVSFGPQARRWPQP